jgi:hypothetical protein
VDAARLAELVRDMPGVTASGAGARVTLLTTPP